MNNLRCIFVFALLIIVVLINPIKLHAEPYQAQPLHINSFWMWTFEDLGYSDLIFPCEQAGETMSVPYYLPENAAQGPDNWYIVHLDYIIEFNDKSEEGFYYLEGSTNNFPCAQTKFHLTNVNGSLNIECSTTDWLNGGKSYSTSSPTIQGKYSNYLMYKGVKPGENILKIDINVNDAKTMIKSLRILKTSAIEYSNAELPKLTIDAYGPKDSIKKGDVFAIEFEVRNAGDLAAHRVNISAVYPQESLELISDGSVGVDSLETSIKGEFKFRTLQTGKCTITCKATGYGPAGTTSADYTLKVGNDGSGFKMYYLFLFVLAFIVLSLAVGYYWKSRLKKRC